MTKLTGEQLRALRLSAEWDQHQMGDALGYSQMHLSFLERGKRTMPEHLDLPTVKEKMVARILSIKAEIENFRC